MSWVPHNRNNPPGPPETTHEVWILDMDGAPDGMVRLDMDPTARLLLPDRSGRRDDVPR